MKATVQLGIAVLLVTTMSLFGQKGAPAKKVAASQTHPESKTWVFHETKDPMTDSVTHTLYLPGTALSQSGDLDEPPSLFFSCDQGKPRTVFVNMGVFLDDPQPLFRFDQEPAKNEHWLTGSVTSKAYYKDDSYGMNAPKSEGREYVQSVVNGADRFVQLMSEHKVLLVRANPHDGAPKTVQFDLSGLSEQLAAHGCPVTVRN